jgi:hypothetical protein
MTPLGDKDCDIAPLLSMVLLKESLDLGFKYLKEKDNDDEIQFLKRGGME